MCSPLVDERFRKSVAPRYCHLQPLGSGAVSEVVAARDTLNNDRPVAIKRIGNLFEGETRSEHGDGQRRSPRVSDKAVGKRALRELCLLRMLEHENIVELQNVVLGGPNAKTFSEMFLVMTKVAKKNWRL